MKKRIDLELWHQGCWMLELTDEFAGVELNLTDICYDGTDVLATVMLDGGEDPMEGVIDAATAKSGVRSIDVLGAHGNHAILHVRYDAEGSIYPAVVNSSLTPVGDVRITEDHEEWTLLADGGAIGSAVAELDELAEIDVRRVIDYEPRERIAHDVVDDIRDEMSVHQIEYLLSALEEGYYGWPREISAKALAAKHDVSGPTALEHLRKGEETILQTVLGMVRDRERGTIRNE